MSFQKIIVSLDDSDRSRAVVEVALDLAQKDQSCLKLLSCVSSQLLGQVVALSEDIGLYPSPVATQAYQMGQSELVIQQNDRLHAILQPYLEAAQQAGLAVEAEVKIGDVGEVVCQVAKDWSANLIVIGRRGRSGLSEALLGSVSNHVLHHATCSVLVVQGTEAEASS
jgi:nucleotide-binding universal stress UspA family protein